MPRFALPLGCVAVLLLSIGFSVRPAQAQQPNYFVRSFIDPNAAPQVLGQVAQTPAHGVNDAGTVVGMYGSPNDTFHAFEWANGQFLSGSFDFPNPGCSFSCGSELNGINDAGEVVGDWVDVNGFNHAYYIIKGKTAVSFDAPNSTLTIATAVNNQGIMVGFYNDTTGAQHGFEFDGTHFTSFDVPGCRTPEVEGVDDKGDVSGWCLGQEAGFEFNPALGALTPIPGPPGVAQARSMGMNNQGQIIGEYSVSGGSFHCFLFTAGAYISFDPMGSTGSFCSAINNSGQFAGDYTNAGNVDQAFLASGPVLLDPVESGSFIGLMDGPVTENDNILPSSGLDDARTVNGVGADGVTEVVIRVPANNAGDQFTLTIQNDQNKSSSDTNGDGALGNPGDSTFTKSQITVSAINITIDPNTGEQAPFAFAVYRAPIDFARQNPDGSYQSGLCNFNSFGSGFGVVSSTPVELVGFKPQSDDQLSCRFVTIQVQDLTNGSSSSAPVIILRPPVVMIHGLWSDWTAWNNFSPLVSGPGTVDSRFYVGRVSYDIPIGALIESADPTYSSPIPLLKAKGNSLGFAFNAPDVQTFTDRWIENFKEGSNPMEIPVAAVQADIVAHSMGGDIVRTMVLLPNFLNDHNFGQGGIHKLITIDTPHLGSPLADANHLLSSQEEGGCVETMLALGGSFVFNTVSFGNESFSGAIGDLAPSSGALKAIAQGNVHPIPTALIAATYSGFSSLFPSNSLIGIACSGPGGNGDALAEDLTATGWPAIFSPDQSDAIVPLNSQLDGLGTGAGSVFPNLLHSPSLEGVLGLGFSTTSVSVLDPSPTNPVPNQVIQLLNTPVTQSVFNPISP